MNKISVEVCRSLVDGEWDVDVIKDTPRLRQVMTINTGMHTKASAMGYAINYLYKERHYLCKERMDLYNQYRNFSYDDLVQACVILEDMERELVKE